MKRLVFVGVLAAAGFGAKNVYDGHTPFGGRHIVAAYADADVVIYGSTTCPYTAEMVRELGREGVPFEVYMIDQDPDADRALQRKLNTGGYEGRGFVTPIIQVNGRFMETPDNVDLEKILLRIDES